MADTDYNAFPDTDHLEDGDVFLITRGGVAYNFAALDGLPLRKGDGFTYVADALKVRGNRFLETDGGGINHIFLGSTSLRFYNADGSTNLMQITPDGDLRLTTGNLLIDHAAGVTPIVSFLIAGSGTVAWMHGTVVSSVPRLTLIGGPSGAGQIRMAGNYTAPNQDNYSSLGHPSERWVNEYFINAPVVSSDERIKTDIGPVPDEWLDAWGHVQWVRYRRNLDNSDRWHVGLIAQRVRDAFSARGLDACEIGLLCFDEWEAAPAQFGQPERDDDGNVVREAEEIAPARAAGNLWSLRYDECFAMEAAWQRRELSRLRAMIEHRAA